MAEKKAFTSSQSKAIAHSGSDLLISAGAGSGKTATLTERIIRKIIDGADISRMLVVTFTKEAANELKSRITARLVSALKDAPDNKHLQAQIVKMSSANISTIHSFCLSVIRPNFDKIGIDNDFRVGEENEIETLMKESMNEVIDFFYENEPENSDFLTVCDCYSQLSSEDKLADELLSLYNKLSSTSLFLDSLIKDTDFDGDFMLTPYGKVLTTELSQFVSHYSPIYKKIIDDIRTLDGTPKYLNAFLSDFEYLTRIDESLKSPTYQGLKEIFDSYTPFPLNGIKDSEIDTVFAKDVREKFKKTLVEKYKGSYFSAKSESIEASLIQNNKICASMHKILTLFNEEFSKKKRSEGVCDFNDIERFAHKLLLEKNGESTALARELSLELDEIYVDEYQDTNSVQNDIFASISRNNRFMVGDIKQSIYRFRSAEPEIFSDYRERFTDVTDIEYECGGNGKTIFMSDNFRCDENVIKLTNDVSDYMFLNSHGIPYEPKDHLIFRKLVPENYVPQPSEICVLDRDLIDEESEKSHELLQAEYVAQRIKEMLDCGVHSSGKSIRPSDIAILLRKGRHKSYYIDALNALGISAEYIDDVKFFEKPHILLLLSLLNAIDNPYKDTYLAGALHSEVFGFTLDELIKIRKATNRNLPLYTSLIRYEKDDEIRAKIIDFQARLEKMQRDVSRLNAYEAVSFVMNESGLISMSSSAQRKDLIKLYNNAREYEKNSFKGLYKYLVHLEGIREKSSKETVFTNPNDCVRIMSIHASKGLEFEICFLCNTETGFALQDTTAPILYERHLGIAGYVGNTGSLVKYNTLMRKCTAIAIDKASKEEEMRVLYVAMTRARTKLIVTAALPKLKDKLETVKMLSPYTSEHYIYSQRSLIDYLLNTYIKPVSYVDFKIIDPNTMCEVTNNGEVANVGLDENQILEYQKILRERFDFKYQYDYLNKIPSKLSVSRLRPNLLDEDGNEEIDIKKKLEEMPRFLSGEQSELQAARGTATHLFLQFCDFDLLAKNGYENERDRLVGESFISERDASLINGEHIEKFSLSSLFDEMRTSVQIHREFRFNVMLEADGLTSDERILENKVLVQGVVDSVFENKMGELILVDYKTDKVTLENYKEVLKERYTSQLSYYKRAIELIFERPLSKVLIYSVPLAKTLQLT
ncbi:MAG: UvrD-helicase domain-containing protein [Clostridia bacterium]|nr:UvrD-helicase domain-containing protein [Clostridia bacterium]